MTKQTDNSVMEEALAATEARLDNWEFTSKPESDQVKILAEMLPRTLLSVLEKDSIIELIVHEKIYDQAVAALMNPDVPSALLQEENKDNIPIFMDFLKQLTVRSARTHELVVPPEYQLTPEQQFIVPVTRGMVEQRAIRQWDGAIGLTKTLSDMGVGIVPTDNERRLAMIISTTLGLMTGGASQQAGAIEEARAGAMMFTP